MMRKPVINAAEAPTDSQTHGAHFAYSMTELAAPLGARSIGANLTRVPAGKAAFPFHHHEANEEHFFVLSGSGVLRLGAETLAIRTHDYIVALPGEAGQAHQFINTGTDDLVFLAISTQRLPEVVRYPDSGKTGVRTQGLDEAGARFLVADAARNAVQYWQGEDGAAVARILAGRD